jgi:hypothetical protein
MTALRLARDVQRGPTPTSIYTIEYMSSAHRGIIMFVEPHKATSAVDALAYALALLPSVGAKYGARGYRVRDAEGRLHRSDAVGHDE